MKFHIDKNLFPTILVNINNDTDIDNKSYYAFIKIWKSQYKNKSNFNFLFDFTNLSQPNLQLLTNFRNDHLFFQDTGIQYLDFSIIIVKTKIISNILTTIWNICPPINTVYLVNDKDKAFQLLDYLKEPFFDKDFIKAFILCNNITIIS